MLILKKGHQPGVYVPLRALFLVLSHECLCMYLYLTFNGLRTSMDRYYAPHMPQ